MMRTAQDRVRQGDSSGRAGWDWSGETDLKGCGAVGQLLEAGDVPAGHNWAEKHLLAQAQHQADGVGKVGLEAHHHHALALHVYATGNDSRPTFFQHWFNRGCTAVRVVSIKAGAGHCERCQAMHVRHNGRPTASFGTAHGAG